MNTQGSIRPYHQSIDLNLYRHDLSCLSYYALMLAHKLLVKKCGILRGKEEKQEVVGIRRMIHLGPKIMLKKDSE